MWLQYLFRSEGKGDQIMPPKFELAYKCLKFRSLEELTDVLNAMSEDDRKEFAQMVEALGIQAPMVVFFNYKTQKWVL